MLHLRVQGKERGAGVCSSESDTDVIVFHLLYKKGIRQKGRTQTPRNCEREQEESVYALILIIFVCLKEKSASGGGVSDYACVYTWNAT